MSIVSKPNTAEAREGWTRVFGEETEPHYCPHCDTRMWFDGSDEEWFCPHCGEEVEA